MKAKRLIVIPKNELFDSVRSLSPFMVLVGTGEDLVHIKAIYNKVLSHLRTH